MLPHASTGPRQRKSRRYIWQGVILLGLGSALLLGCKLSFSAWTHSVLLFSGGGALLLGNGYMLYGLLHHADDRVYADEQQTKPFEQPVGQATEMAHPLAAPPQADITPAPNPQPSTHECG